MLASFRSAPPARQAAVAGGLVLLLCGLFAFAYFALLRPSYAILFTDLRDSDAATIVAELERSGVDHRLADGGRTILVPEPLVDSTRLAVMSRDLPLRGGVGFELFDNSSIGLTDFAQRINLQRALQGELSRTITSIEGVESARVHLSLGETTVFRGDRRPPSASVTVHTRRGHRLTGATVRGIQRLVAGSVPDLAYRDVAVLNARGALVSSEAAAAAPSPADAEKSNVESLYERRVRAALEGRYTADAIDASVWAEMAPDAAAAPGEVAGAAGRRDFRLRVTVAIAAPLSVAAQEQAAADVRAAIGFDPVLGDIVTVAAAPGAAAGAEWEGSLAAPPPPGQAPSAAGGLAWPPGAWTILILLLALAAVIALVRRRRAAPARIDSAARIAFAERLRLLVDEEDRDAAAA